MPRIDLPEEIWASIFSAAADEDIIFDHGFLTVFASSSWFWSILGGTWTLRTPQDSLNLRQRRSYATKKAIISTCKSWRRIGSEFLFRCLFFDEPAKMHALCAILDSESALGRWTRRIHIARYPNSHGATLTDMENSLVPIIRHCPNLEVFVIDWKMSTAFGPVADALCTYCPNALRSVHWNVPFEALPKVIWALDSLPALVSVHLGFDAPTSENLHLGAASDIHLDLPRLLQLSLRGSFEEFLEQASGWNMPSLRSVSVDSGSSRNDQPDLIEFLTHHGAELTFLDLYSIPPHDTAQILDLCPLLTTFSFNADWRSPTTNGDIDDVGGELVNHPHEHITHIGLHGLLYAFGVGFAAAYASRDPTEAHLKIRQTNDRNFAALTRANFPKLECVRVLSHALLRDLEKADGPARECFERWDRWWAASNGMGIRLEDCTGDLLGNLPQSPEEGDDDDDDEGSSEEDTEQPREGSLADLRLLLEQCRKLSENRDDPMLGQPMWS